MNDDIKLTIAIGSVICAGIMAIGIAVVAHTLVEKPDPAPAEIKEWCTKFVPREER